MKEKLNIRCRGRNGFFAYNETTVSHVTDIESNEPRVYVEVRSKTFGRMAPIQFYGHPEDVKELLLEALDKVDPPKTVVTDPKVKDIGELI
jgi:hypothetical protein